MDWFGERVDRYRALWGEQWANTTLDAALVDAAQRDPSRPAVVDAGDGTVLTYEQLDRLAGTVAQNLLRCGVGPGDVVSAQLPNIWQFVVLYAGLTRLGAAINPLMPNYRDSELRYNLAAAHTKMMVVLHEYRSFDHVEMLRRVRGDLPELELVCVVDPGADLGDDAFAFDELLVDVPEGPTVPLAPVDPDAPSLFLFTSGSESKPKLVVHTHNTADFELAPGAAIWKVDASDVVLVAAPVGHGAGFQWCLRLGMLLGSTNVLMDAWDAAEALALIERHGVTFTFAPTRFLQDLVQAGRESSARVTLRTFASGGAPIPRALVDEAREHLGARVLASYGQTETFLATSTRHDDSPDKIASTDGNAFPGAEVLIVDGNGEEVPRGEVGECITRGPAVALGYLNDAAATARAFRDDGWLYTGDQCVMDGDGYIRVVGRTKEIIIRNGLNLSPVEIEDHLVRMPQVREAAVVGLPNDAVGERICAFLLADDGSAPPTLADVREHFEHAGVARYKTPEALILVDDIPRSAVGKTQRNELRASLANGGYACTEKAWSD